MAEIERPAARGDRLKAEIAAAEARLTDRRNLEWAGIGELVETLSNELNEATDLYDADPDAAQSRLDRIEQRLGEARARLDAAEGRAG